MANTLQDAMALAGLAPSKPIDLPGDGKVHRYRVTGDKAGSRNGWVVSNDGPEAFGAFGAFGSWRTGETHTWRAATSTPLTPAEKAAMAQRMKAMRLSQAQALEAVHAEARTRAEKLWRLAHPAANDHPYLQRKQIPAIGIRRLRDMLVIAARDVSGTLHTLQFGELFFPGEFERGWTATHKTVQIEWDAARHVFQTLAHAGDVILDSRM
jgi:putative DNA primase/helicase